MHSFFIVLFSFFFAVQASPLWTRAKNDVFVPAIISPNTSTIWNVGQNETVTWDTSQVPQNISNLASIYLVSNTTPSDQILLASNFSLRTGMENITVPANATSGPYYIILFGDSGNASPVFSIQS